MISVSIDSTFDPKRLLSQIQKQVEQETDSGVARAIAKIRSESYIGATGELKANWRQERSRFSGGELRAGIVNALPDAVQRIAGSPPGTRVDGNKLKAWIQRKFNVSNSVAQKLVPVVSRKIARFGTDRWISRRNFLSLGINGQLRPDSFIFRETVPDLTNRLSNLKL